MKTLLAAATLLALVGAYAASVDLAVALAPASGAELALEGQGARVVRDAAGPLPAILHDPGRPDVVLLAHAGRLLGPERDALRAFVEAGGQLWVVGERPDAARLVDDDAWDLLVLPGALRSASGAAATLDVDGRGAMQADGALALGRYGAAFAPLVSAGRDAFRDSNGDGTLGEGEPSGPFVVGVAAKLGAGRVVVLATSEPDLLLRAPFAGHLLLGLASPRVLVVDHARSGAWASPGAALLQAASCLGRPVAGVVVLLVLAGCLTALALPKPRPPAGRHARLLARRDRRLAAATPGESPP